MVTYYSRPLLFFIEYCRDFQFSAERMLYASVELMAEERWGGDMNTRPVGCMERVMDDSTVVDSWVIPCCIIIWSP